jgi:predicted O-methyltransferase YrrM
VSTPEDVDAWFTEHLHLEDDALRDARERARAAGLPAIAVTPSHGALLATLARLGGAQRVLEVGTLGGYSTIWLARALPTDGELVTCEIDPHHAEVAAANFVRAGVDKLIDLRVGPARDTLATLDGGFDLAFIDADKASGADYFRSCVRLVRSGGVIIVDNVVRAGTILDPGSADEAVIGTWRLADAIAAEPGVDATVMQTVGGKRHDGFVMAVVQ